MNPPLPPGWVSAVDPISGRTYFANAATGESSWTPPALPPPPQDLPRLNTIATTGMHQQHQLDQKQQQYQQQHHHHHHHQVDQPNFYQQATAPIPAVDSVNPTVTSAASLASSGLLVPAARAVVDAKTMRNSDEDTYFELHALTAGQIADLCAIHQEELATKEDVPFEPYVNGINPYQLPTMAKRAPMEAGRLDIRVHSLYEKLKKIKQ